MWTERSVHETSYRVTGPYRTASSVLTASLSLPLTQDAFVSRHAGQRVTGSLVHL
jgi:hypothetical protein